MSSSLHSGLIYRCFYLIFRYPCRHIWHWGLQWWQVRSVLWLEGIFDPMSSCFFTQFATVGICVCIHYPGCASQICYARLGVRAILLLPSVLISQQSPSVVAVLETGDCALSPYNAPPHSVKNLFLMSARTSPATGPHEESMGPALTCSSPGWLTSALPCKSGPWDFSFSQWPSYGQTHSVWCPSCTHPTFMFL